ncbi:putative enzyme [Nitrospira tepida]|uniref:Enzyme n=1 Tax=Nitrospira tepida TaxID=2973512 RepID=A0AA86MYS3_9BACT|nr:type II toxin-antitoxin system HicA family toxin [Nitrospira tepida]CAI4031447.1 putative enzyme [Nitrospira tepida]
MTKLPQVFHDRVVRALKHAGFYVLREGKHISMTNDKHLVIIPRHHTIKPGTLKHILDSAEISPEQFKDLL